jgi:hypothetical protein
MKRSIAALMGCCAKPPGFWSGRPGGDHHLGTGLRRTSRPAIVVLDHRRCRARRVRRATYPGARKTRRLARAATGVLPAGDRRRQRHRGTRSSPALWGRTGHARRLRLRGPTRTKRHPQGHRPPHWSRHFIVRQPRRGAALDALDLGCRADHLAPMLFRSRAWWWL